MTLPSPPRSTVLQKVVDVETAEATLRSTRETLADLETELRDAEARAEAAERRIADLDSPFARETLAAVEELVEGYLAVARDEMRTTRERAEEAAAQRILDAEAEAASVTASVRSELSLALLARTDGALEQLLHPLLPSEAPIEEVEAPAAGPSELVEGDSAFERFWEAEEPPPPPRAGISFWPVEALLPILALTLLLVVVLVLVG